VIRQAAQILANRAGIPVEKVEAVIIQIALQISQSQGKSITAQSIFQIATQIVQDLNGVLAQAILKLVNQDDGGKSSQTVNIINNVVKGGGDGSGSQKITNKLKVIVNPPQPQPTAPPPTGKKDYVLVPYDSFCLDSGVNKHCERVDPKRNLGYCDEEKFDCVGDDYAPPLKDDKDKPYFPLAFPAPPEGATNVDSDYDVPPSGVIRTKGGVQVWRETETGELMYKVPRSIQDAVFRGDVETAKLFQKELDDAIQQLDGQGRQTSIQADQTTPGPTVELAELPPAAEGESPPIAGATTPPAAVDTTTPSASTTGEGAAPPGQTLATASTTGEGAAPLGEGTTGGDEDEIAEVAPEDDDSDTEEGEEGVAEEEEEVSDDEGDDSDDDGDDGGGDDGDDNGDGDGGDDGGGDEED
jgi:hypothetical protein